jgi:hypothetical protein
MIQFKRLEPEDFGKYEIEPPEFLGQITWYAYPRVYYDGGPWLVLAFKHPKNYPYALTLHLCYYDEEYLWSYDDDEANMATDGKDTRFEILHDSTGLCSFSEAILKDFIALLQHHGNLLTETGRARPVTFKPIDQETELSRWRFQPVRIPGMPQVYSYYYQLDDPLVAADSGDFVTIVRFSRSAGKELFLGLHHFPQAALEDSAYKPEDESMGCINLDRKGIDDFIDLLQDNWHFLRV